MKFVIFSHENYFLPVVMKFKSPFIWADMTKMECEPKEAHPLDMEMKQPTEIPDEAWNDFFEVELEKRRLLQGKGILTRYPAAEVTEKLLSLPKNRRKDYMVIFDFNHGTMFGDKLFEAGFTGIFARSWAYDLERKREKASQLVEKYYKEVMRPKQVKFATGSADKIIQFLEKDKENIWVIKPNGEGLWVFNPESEDPPIALEECIHYLEANKEAVNGLPMILEQKIIGTEINIETGYSQGIPIFANVDLENKFMHPEEKGHQSGCSFDLVFPVPLNCKLRKICNEPFDKLAKKLNFTGLMDMNAIISNKDNKPYFLEFCPNRFGYNSLFTEMEVYGKPPEDFLVDFVTGKSKWPDKTFGASMKIFNEDFNEDYYNSIFKPKYENVEVQLSDGWDSIWPFDVFKKGGKYLLANYSPEAIVVTAKSDTPEGAIEKAKLAAERRLSFDGKYLRSDFDEFDRVYNPVFRYRFLRDRRLLEAENEKDTH